MDTVLADSRFKKEASLEIFPLKKATRLRFLRFQLLSFWGKGGGLQHFSAVPAEMYKYSGTEYCSQRQSFQFPCVQLVDLKVSVGQAKLLVGEKGQDTGPGLHNGDRRL